MGKECIRSMDVESVPYDTYIDVTGSLLREIDRLKARLEHLERLEEVEANEKKPMDEQNLSKSIDMVDYLSREIGRLERQLADVKESEVRLAGELSNVAHNLRHGWLDNPITLQAQLLSIDTALKKRPNPIDNTSFM